MLPRMTMGNWLFWSIMVWLGFNFTWLKFIEQSVPQLVGAAIATVLSILVFKYGPRPQEEEEEE